MDKTNYRIPVTGNPGRFSGSLLTGAALGSVALVTLLIYLPGLNGPFLLDDLVNLQQIGDGEGVTDLQSAVNYIFGNRSGPAGRPVATASFLLNARDWPAAAAGFKAVNLFLHILTGLLTAWFSLLLFRVSGVREVRARILAVGVAALWLLHPLNVSTTLYVVQRMTQLMALFSLAGLICYVKGRAAVDQQTNRGLLLMSLCLFPFGLLAVLSKENGALLLAAILTLEITVFSKERRGGLLRLWLAAGVLLPLAVVSGYLILNFTRLTAAYEFREFSLGERLLTEGRIVIDYLFNILLPGIRDFTLQHDDYIISRSLLEPISTLSALLTIVALLTAGVVLRRRQPVFSLAVLWFFGWHLLESTFIPLELYFEHRNYLPMIGPLFAVVFYLARLADHLAAKGYARIVPTAGVAAVIAMAVLTLQLTLLWGNNLALAARWAERHPASYRAQVEFAYIQAESGAAESGYLRLSALQQRYHDEVALQLKLWNFACSYGFPAPYPVTEIAASARQVYYRADLTTEVKTLLENLFAGQCSYPARQDIEALLVRLEAVPMRTFEKSGFYVLFSDLYIYYRELNPALIQLRNAFDLRPDPGFPIRQAILSASAGNYQDSLLFLQRAREADENRGSFTPSRLGEIAEMEQDLRARLGSN